MSEREIRNPDCVYKPVLEALEEWNEFLAPMRSLGFRVIGFDVSGVTFSWDECKNNAGAWTMAVGAVRAINKAINDQSKQ